MRARRLTTRIAYRCTPAEKKFIDEYAYSLQVTTTEILRCCIVSYFDRCDLTKEQHKQLMVLRGYHPRDKEKT